MTVIVNSTSKSNSKSRSKRRRSRTLRDKEEINNNLNDRNTNSMQIELIEANDPNGNANGNGMSESDNENEIIMCNNTSPRMNDLNDECTLLSQSSQSLNSPTISMNSPSSNSIHSSFSYPIPMDTEEEDEEEQDQNENELREFRFNIENDANLQSIINNNLNDNLHRQLFNNFDMITTDNNNNNILLETDNMKEFTSEYILSKLYNYMKISEMNKYGISVFEITFCAYLPYLYECDLIKLASSYWCNGQHFNRMISHRGDIIKSNCRLKLVITQELLDSAMQSGASVDKIEAMLLRKRIDEGTKINLQKNSCNALCFYHTKSERNFYLRNLKHRFWNHEVLVRVFIQNGWLTPNLANIAMKTFIKTVYHRVLQSKSAYINQQNNYNNNINSRSIIGGGIKFSENFLHSFFVSYFCLDDIPKMYKKEITQKMNSNQNNNYNNNISYVNCISEETLRRWCELIELLSSRGAKINEYEFRKIIPLQYALNIGKNTYKIISCPYKLKNQLFIPQSYHQENIYIPDDVWNILISYL